MSLFRGRPTGKFRSNRLTQVLTIRFFVLFAPKLVYPVPVKMAPKTVGELRPTHFKQGLPLWKRLVR